MTARCAGVTAGYAGMTARYAGVIARCRGMVARCAGALHRRANQLHFAPRRHRTARWRHCAIPWNDSAIPREDSSAPRNHSRERPSPPAMWLRDCSVGLQTCVPCAEPPRSSGELRYIRIHFRLLAVEPWSRGAVEFIGRATLPPKSEIVIPDKKQADFSLCSRRGNGAGMLLRSWGEDQPASLRRRLRGHRRHSAALPSTWIRRPSPKRWTGNPRYQSVGW